MSTTQINDGTTTAVVRTALPGTSDAGIVVREAEQGQQTMANSRPVVLASDQIVPVQLTSSNKNATAGVQTFTNNFKLFDFRFLGQDNRLLWYESTTGAGASTFSTTTNMLSMNVTAANGDQVIRQTQRIMGQSCAPTLWIIGCNIGAIKANVTQRIGAFDANDGLFFQQNGSNLSVVYRSSISGSPVDTVINQSSWNVDKLDGTGASGVTLNTADYNVYFVVDNYGFLQFGIIINNTAYYCHQVSNPNTATTTIMTVRNFPIRAEITNTAGTAGSTSLTISNCSAFVSGGTTPYGLVRSIDLGVTGKVVPATLTPLISLRLKSTNVRNKLLVQSINILLSASQTIYYALIFNGVLTGAVFSAVPGTNTISEFDSSASAISGGDIIFSSYTSGSGQGNGNAPSPSLDVSSLLQVSSNIAGTSDLITLAAMKSGGTSPTAFPSLLFREFV